MGMRKRGRSGRGKKAFLKMRAGPPVGQAAPNRASTQAETVSHLRDCSHARLVRIGRNETRVLSLVFVAEVNSGTPRRGPQKITATLTFIDQVKINRGVALPSRPRYDEA